MESGRFAEKSVDVGNPRASCRTIYGRHNPCAVELPRTMSDQTLNNPKKRASLSNSLATDRC